MTTDLLMPKLGLTMQEGLLAEWRVEPGDSVGKGQILYVVETEKIATEIESEADGVFEARLAEEGSVVPVGAPVGRFSPAEGSARLAPATPKVTENPDAQLQAALTPVPAIRAMASHSGLRIVATPLARRMARAKNIDLSGVAGSGPRGRIKAADVETAQRAGIATPTESAQTESTTSTRRKASVVHAAMARRLAEVKHGVPHFYLSTEIEVSQLLELRQRLNAQSGYPRLTMTHFVLAAVGRALVDFPNINRVWDDGFFEEIAGSDVAMAVQAEGGLFVPVVRNAGTDSIDKIAVSARQLTEKARSGRLDGRDMAGAAISVSNAGMHDVTWLTSIINPGHSAILGVGSVRETFRPDANGQPVLKREMGCVFSGDHRVHTGVEGLAFLNRVKDLLQDPLQLLRSLQHSGTSK